MIFFQYNVFLVHANLYRTLDLFCIIYFFTTPKTETHPPEATAESIDQVIWNMVPDVRNAAVEYLLGDEMVGCLSFYTLENIKQMK